MALSAAFRERIEQMEHTRNERLALLEAEKELQVSKSKVLASKIAKKRATEQRCLMLDRRIAIQNFRILSLKADMENLDAKYLIVSQEYRLLKDEIEELEEMDKERKKLYDLKSLEMNEFRDKVDKYLVETRNQVQQLKDRIIELKSIFTGSQSNNGYENNTEIAEAESKKYELHAIAENIEKRLGFNYKTRAQLEKQLENMLMRRNKISKNT